MSPAARPLPRFVPALALLLLAPLIGELLLGNLPLTSLGTLAALPVLTLLYGTGAVVIREVTVRAGRGWPTLIMLAVGYGVIEEGLVTQSLFNPSFNGLHLLDYGRLPVIGLGLPWTLFVLTIHSVWSMVVPCALIEFLFPAHRGRPWLGVGGLVAAIVLYLIGAAALGFGTAYTAGFVAAPGQLIGTVVVAAIMVAAGFVIFRRTGGDRRLDPNRGRESWSPTMIGGLALLAGSAFFLLYHLGVSRQLLPPVAYVIGAVLLITAVALLVARTAGRGGWGDRQRFGLVAGAVLTYCWAGILVQTSQYGFHPGTLLLQLALIAGAATLLFVARSRLVRTEDGSGRHQF